MPVIVVATITPKEGMLDDVEAVFAANIPKVHTEPGCELYALHKGKDALVMVEKWADEDALKVHMGSPAMQAIGEGLGGKLAGRPEIVTLESIPFGDGGKGAL